MLKGFSFFYLSLFLAGTAVFLTFRRKDMLRASLLAEIVLIYAFFTLLPNNDYRYIAPVYVLMSVFACAWLPQL